MRACRFSLFGFAVLICVTILLTGCSSPAIPSQIDSGKGGAYQFAPPTPWRQARLDAFCGQGRPANFAECERFFLQHPNSEPGADDSGWVPSNLGVASAPTPGQSQPQIEVSFTSPDGTLVVPAIINGAIQLNFILDTGASLVSIPADVVTTLKRTGTISDADFLGKRTIVLADGSRIPSLNFRIRSLKVGDIVVKNVIGTVTPVSGDLLLGQSFLKHFRHWSIDNQRMVLVLE